MVFSRRNVPNLLSRLSIHSYYRLLIDHAWIDLMVRMIADCYVIKDTQGPRNAIIPQLMNTYVKSTGTSGKPGGGRGRG